MERERLWGSSLLIWQERWLWNARMSRGTLFAGLIQSVSSLLLPLHVPLNSMPV